MNQREFEKELERIGNLSTAERKALTDKLTPKIRVVNKDCYNDDPDRRFLSHLMFLKDSQEIMDEISNSDGTLTSYVLKEYCVQPELVLFKEYCFIDDIGEKYIKTKVVIGLNILRAVARNEATRRNLPIIPPVIEKVAKGISELIRKSAVLPESIVLAYSLDEIKRLILEDSVNHVLIKENEEFLSDVLQKGNSQNAYYRFKEIVANSTIAPGVVVCDLCGKDFSDDDDTPGGGIYHKNTGVCPNCLPSFHKSCQDTGDIELLKPFPKDKSFKQSILDFRKENYGSSQAFKEITSLD